jgi:DegV family protein with EDD domain
VTGAPDLSTRPPVIVTDAACDVPPEDIQRYGITVAPLRILFGEETYRSGIDISHEQFYARMARGDVHPSTSQPTVAEFKDMYRELAGSGAPILSIHLSEGLSGTVNVARQAARELPDLDITVHDSGTLTSAMGLQVLTAARAAEQGHPVPKIVEWLKNDYFHGGMLFCVDDLSYLYRGGRIGAVRYQLGQVLHIKPIITVAKTGDHAGTYISAGRVRSLPKAIDAFIAHVTDQLGAGSTLRAVTLYGDDPTLARQLSARLAEQFNCVYLKTVPTAPVLGVHVGPSALAIGYAAGDWPA